MEKEFVTYELALRLKEFGFDEPCFGTYDSRNSKLYEWSNAGDIKAPLYQQAFRFFRENYDLLGIPTHSKFTIISNKWVGQPLYGNYNSYEEAELACLDKLIELTFKSE